MDLLAAAGVFLTAISVLIAYFAMPRENREDLQAFLRRIFGFARATAGFGGRFLITAMPLAALLNSTYGIWIFYSSEAAIRRGEVIVLGLHMINALFYSAACGGVISLWVKRWQAKQEKAPASTGHEKARQ